MSGIFDGVYGAQFPEVVMNSGPLPPTGGLPAPLHDTADGKINYNNTLLGDLQPYAYGSGAYLSTQQSYLNIPHRIQKILPVIYLPEPNGQNTFRLSHSVDDGDVAFSMRLDKSSLFCTNLQHASKRQSLGTIIDPFINLPTLNYILAGIQIHTTMDNNNGVQRNLWHDFLFSLDKTQFHTDRDYVYNEMTVQDLVHVIRSCIRPFGIVRGSEKQGGQNEMTDSPATWPVPFSVVMVIDGKEDHVVNMWNHMDISAGEDLVLHLKPMPLQKYTLNHYYKHPVSKQFDKITGMDYVWQLVPNKFSLEQDIIDMYQNINPDNIKPQWLIWYEKPIALTRAVYFKKKSPSSVQIMDVQKLSWQEIGYWHIGRTQIRIHKYAIDDTLYYHNDMVNNLHSQYMMMTFEPIFQKHDFFWIRNCDFEPGLLLDLNQLRDMSQNKFSKKYILGSGLHNVPTKLLGSLIGDSDKEHVPLTLNGGWEIVTPAPLVAASVTPAESSVMVSTTPMDDIMSVLDTSSVEPAKPSANNSKEGIVKRRKIQGTVKLNNDGTLEKQDAVSL
jgi:hypothetical protein